jgi:hypothetical protein
VSYAEALPFASRFDPPLPDSLVAGEASRIRDPSMTDLIYIVAGIAVLGLYGLYALALRKL